MIKNLINRLYIKKIFLVIFFLLFVSCEQSKLESNKDLNKKIVIKVFSSLTCPHCANFHQEVIVKLKKNYIDTNRVKFEHHSFPLDLAALNAEKILHCFVDPKKKFDFLSLVYKKQKKWATGSDINVINSSIKIIGKKIGLNDKNMDKCLNDKKIEEQILDTRINAQKKYKINSTPTIYINEELYEGKHDYKLFKKELDQLL